MLRQWWTLSRLREFGVRLRVPSTFCVVILSRQPSRADTRDWCLLQCLHWQELNA